MRRPWPESVTGRLALLFAVVAMLTFALLGSYLRYSLAKELERHDDMELIGKVALVRHLLEQESSAAAVAQDQHLFLDAVVGHHGLILQLESVGGKTILANAAASAPLPEISIVPLDRQPTFADIHDWTPAKGIGRVVRAMGATANGSGDAIEIVLGLEADERTALLRSYSQTLALAIAIGALLMAALGYLVTRVALRPIRVFTDQANSISAHRLHSRLPMDNVPSEFRALASSFNAMFDRLEEGIQRLSNFAADLAHDLRTPINNLMVQTQVVLSKPRAPSEYQALLESETEEYERLAQTIENTLFLARADNAQLALQLQPLEVHLELERIGQYFEGLAEEARITLSVQSPEIVLPADRVLFQRAVSNLVSNAVRHTPTGGRVRISAQATDRSVQVLVENTGSGISAEQIEKIFERYYRADPARSVKTGTAGLGLAIVRAIMKLHGGDVTVESAAGEVTIFTLSFNT